MPVDGVGLPWIRYVGDGEEFFEICLVGDERANGRLVQDLEGKEGKFRLAELELKNSTWYSKKSGPGPGKQKESIACSRGRRNKRTERLAGDTEGRTDLCPGLKTREEEFTRSGRRPVGINTVHSLDLGLS